MTDLANASVLREEPGPGEYFRRMMQNDKEMKDSLANTIDRVASKGLGGG